MDPQHSPFVKLPVEDSPNYPYAYQTTYKSLLLSGFNYLQGFQVSDYRIDFRNTFAATDDTLPDDDTRVASYINQQMKTLQHAKFGLSKQVKVGRYIAKTNSYRFHPISPYKTYVVFNPRPSHGQGKLPDKITYQFVNAAQIKSLKMTDNDKNYQNFVMLSNREIMQEGWELSANIIFHIVGIVDNDISKVRAKIDLVQLYKRSDNGFLSIKTIRLSWGYQS